ncbi:MAG: hypothetical protein WAN47_09245 [Nitrosotalea sp.]
MNDDQFSILTNKLDFLTKALLVNIIKDLDFKNQVITLYKIGMKESEIKDFLKTDRDKVHAIVRKMN